MRRAGLVGVGLYLAAWFTQEFSRFSALAEPDEFSLGTVAFGAAVGLMSQAGLLLSPWAAQQGRTLRAAAGLLMLPSFLFLVACVYGTIEGLFTRHPPTGTVSLTYLVGVGAYGLGYADLLRSGRKWQRRRGVAVL